MEIRLGEEPRVLDDGTLLPDPPMSEYEKQTIEMIREAVPHPFYRVYKIRQDVKNETGLTWNLDYCVTKGAHIITVLIKVLGADTTIANIDERMRDAFATFSLHRETKNGGLYDDVHWRLLLAKDDVLNALGSEGYRPYHYAFERLSVQIVWMSEALDELKRIRQEIEDPESNRIIRD